MPSEKGVSGRVCAELEAYQNVIKSTLTADQFGETGP